MRDGVACEIDELHRLAAHDADREVGAAHERLDEPGDTDTENAGAVVIDQDRDLHPCGRRSEADDPARLVAFPDDEVVGPEIGVERTARVERGDVDLPRLALRRADRRGGANQHHDANDPHGVLPLAYYTNAG